MSKQRKQCLRTNSPLVRVCLLGLSHCNVKLKQCLYKILRMAVR